MPARKTRRRAAGGTASAARVEKPRPTIHRAVSLGGERYLPGDEERLESAATAEQMQHYTNRRTVSGFAGYDVEEGFETREGRYRMEAQARAERRKARGDSPSAVARATSSSPVTKRRAARKSGSRNARKAAKTAAVETNATEATE